MSFRFSARRILALAAMLVAVLPAHADPLALDIDNSPIDFWGKVVDDKGSPVAGATATIAISGNPVGGAPPAFSLPSDAGGLFSLTGRKGLGIQVSVAKDGYYPAPTLNLDYAVKGTANQPFPTAEYPSLFVLIAKGPTPALIHKQIRVPLLLNGTPVEINLALGKVAAAGRGDLKVETWVLGKGVNSGHNYSWKCRVTVPEGGLQAQTGTDFKAPLTGYSPQDEEIMEAEATTWSGRMQRQYVLVISGKRYVSLHFQMITGWKNYLDLDYFLNPQPGDPDLGPVAP